MIGTSQPLSHKELMANNSS